MWQVGKYPESGSWTWCKMLYHNIDLWFQHKIVKRLGGVKHIFKRKKKFVIKQDDTEQYQEKIIPHVSQS